MKRNALTKSSVSVKWGRTQHDQRTNHYWQLANRTCCVVFPVQCSITQSQSAYTLMHFMPQWYQRRKTKMDIPNWQIWHTLQDKNKRSVSALPRQWLPTPFHKTFIVTVTTPNYAIRQSQYPVSKSKANLGSSNGGMLCIAPLIWVSKHLCGPHGSSVKKNQGVVRRQDMNSFQARHCLSGLQCWSKSVSGPGTQG